jgi:hypothetical protein
MNEIFNSYVLAFDELNALTSTSYYSATETEQVIDDVLSFLIKAYQLGIQAASKMLAYDLSLDVNSMRDAIYAVIDGKTFEDRVADHVTSGDLGRLQALVESEYQRVFNIAICDGGSQFQRDRGWGVSKTWTTMMDEKVRDTHKYLEGMTVALDEEFYTYDGDHAPAPHGFTKVENNANCRCVVTLKLDEWQD